MSDPATAEILKPYYRYICKRPCFHDEYLPAFNNANVTLIDCPAGIERITDGPRSSLAAVRSRLHRLRHRLRGGGHTPGPPNRVTASSGAGASRWPRSGSRGASSLFGMLTRGFPEHVRDARSGQQSVVTVNYTQLAELGAFVGGAIR